MIAFGSTAFHPELSPDTLQLTAAQLDNQDPAQAEDFFGLAAQFAEIRTLPVFTGWVRGEDNLTPKDPWADFS